MKFLGIDLGWTSGASGLCCLIWQDETLRLVDLDRRESIADILAWVDAWMPPNEGGMVAVDAPTLISNPTGMRLADRLTHRYFGRYHAGCYPANLGRPFAARTTGFGLSLEARGFSHAPTIEARQQGRYQIEVFPHAATIHLFNLKRILKYKKGRLAERRVGLMQLRQLILSELPALEPPLSPLDLPEIPLVGRALKDLEDRLDSLICAYIAAHWWYWGLERNWVLGVSEMGIGDREVGGRVRPAGSPVPEKQNKSLPVTPSPYYLNPVDAKDFPTSGYIVVPQPLIRNESPSRG